MAAVSIKVLLNEKPALDALKSLTKAFKDNATSINQSLELIKKAWGAITGAIGIGIDAVVDWTKAAMEAEKNERKLIAALGLHKAATQENINALNEFNKALQRKGMGDADDLASLQARLLALGVLPSKLQDATKATLGLAEATGKGLNRSAQAVAKAFGKGEGEEGLLSLFSLVEARAESLESKISTLTSNFGDLEEELGKTFTSSGALKGGLDTINNLLSDFTDYFNSTEGRKDINAFFSLILTLTAATIDAFVGMVKIIRESTKEIRLMTAILNEGGIKEGLAAFQASENQVAMGQGVLGILTNAADRARVAANRGVEFGPELPPGFGQGGGGLDTDRKRKRKKVPTLDQTLSEDAKNMLRIGSEESKLIFEEEEKLMKQEQERLVRIAELRSEEIAAQKKFQDVQSALRNDEFNAELAQLEKDRQLKEQRGEQAKQFYGNLFSTTLTGLGMVAGAIINGEGNVGAALANLFAGILDSTGDFLIAQGGASEVAAQLFALFGVPGVGLGTIAAGIALKVAAGVARSAFASDLSDPSKRGAGVQANADFAKRILSGGGSTVGDTSGVPSSGFTSSPSNQPIVNNYSINFGRTFVAGDEATVGREVKRMIRAADRLGGH